MSDGPSDIAEEEPGLDEAEIRSVAQAIAEGRIDEAVAFTAPMHASDQADLLSQLGVEPRLALVRALGDRLDADAISYLDADLRDELIDALGLQGAGAVLAQLETDDQIEVLSDLDPAEQAALLAELPPDERLQVEQGLAFPEYSAGRLMSRELVAIPSYWTVGQTIDRLRAGSADLPDEFYDVFIVDPRFRPVGTVHVSQILRSPREAAMAGLRMKQLHLVDALTEQEEVARTFQKYGLVSAPVVAGDGRLVGVVTVDDVVDVIEEEAEDDLLKLGGVQETDVHASPWATVRRRLPWLVVNLATAILASLVIARFEGAIAQLVALAVLMPMVASMGGNAGTQALTVAVRALAVKDLTSANAWRVFAKEAGVALLNGFAFAVIGAATALVWFGDPALASVFGAAMLINLLAAGMAGVAIPYVLDRLGFDPAVSSTVFVTTVTDVVGFFAFLGLAVWFLV